MIIFFFFFTSFFDPKLWVFSDLCKLWAFSEFDKVALSDTFAACMDSREGLLFKCLLPDLYRGFISLEKFSFFVFWNWYSNPSVSTLTVLPWRGFDCNSVFWGGAGVPRRLCLLSFKVMTCEKLHYILRVTWIYCMITLCNILIMVGILQSLFSEKRHCWQHRHYYFWKFMRHHYDSIPVEDKAVLSPMDVP